MRRLFHVNLWDTAIQFAVCINLPQSDPKHKRANIKRNSGKYHNIIIYIYDRNKKIFTYRFYVPLHLEMQWQNLHKIMTILDKHPFSCSWTILSPQSATIKFYFSLTLYLKLGFATATHNFQVCENNSYLFNSRPNIYKSWCLNIHSIPNNCNLLTKQIENDYSRAERFKGKYCIDLT